MPWAEVSLEQPQSSSAGDAFVARRCLSRRAGHRRRPRRRGMGTLALPVLLLVKVAGSTHFPVFFCQRWEKGPNILPAYESKTPWRDCKKPSWRATSRRLVPPQSRRLLSTSVNCWPSHSPLSVCVSKTLRRNTQTLLPFPAAIQTE